MKRVITSVILGCLLIGTLLLREISLSFFDALIGILLVFASMEFCNALDKQGKANIKYISMIYPILMYVMYVFAINNQYTILQIIISQSLLLVVLTAFTFALKFIIMLFENRKLNKKNKIAYKKIASVSVFTSLNTLFSFVYPSLILGLLFILNHLSQFSFAQSNSIFSIKIETILISLIFIITFSTDIFAYCVGSVFGGPKLSPLISPKKTISGSIGGILASTFSITLLFYITNAMEIFNSFYVSLHLGLLIFIVLAIIGSIISQLGDLFASFIKRKSGIKDFGNILPGHGGIIDRFDGVIFNTIFVFIFVCILLVL